MKRIHPLLMGAIACLVIWALMVSLALVVKAQQNREAPEPRMYEWAALLNDKARKHGGSLAGWDAAAMLDRFRAEQTRPYSQLALVDTGGKVIASSPAGWEGRSVSEIEVGEAKLAEMLNQPPYYMMRRGYVEAPEDLDSPRGYSGKYLVADSVWLQGPPFPAGLLVAIRPGIAYGELWNQERLGKVVPHGESWRVERRPAWFVVLIHQVGYLSFLGYWILLAVWVYRDARSKGQQALSWGIIALATNLVGVGAYLMARPSQTCTHCEQHLAASWRYCPFCGAQKQTA